MVLKTITIMIKKINKSKHYLYPTWKSMITRCNNKKYRDYKRYGGRGITVCKEWLDFETFVKDMGERPEGKSIDRIDTLKGYYKENCRWATPKEQGRNRRDSKQITFRGKTQNLPSWADELNINESLLYNRIRQGWTIKKAATTPQKERLGGKENLAKKYVALWKDQEREIQKIADKRRISFSQAVRELLLVGLETDLSKLK